MFRTVCIPATLPGTPEAVRGHFVSFPFVHSSCPRPPAPCFGWPCFCHRSLGTSQGALDAEGEHEEERKGDVAEGGSARGTAAGVSGLSRGAHLQVPVDNIFLVTVVHGRHNLQGRGEERRLVACDLSASHRDPRNLPTTELWTPGLPKHRP